MLQQIQQNIMGGLGTRRAGPAQSVERKGKPFKSFVGVLDGDAAYDTAAEVAAIVDAQAAGGIFELIWQMTVPAQQEISWGFGTPAFQNNQGYLHFVSMDVATGFQEGVIRLVIANARETERITVAEMPTQRLHTTTFTTLATATPTDNATMQPLPEKVEFDLVGEDSLLQIWHRTTVVTTTVDMVDFQIPITVYQ